MIYRLAQVGVQTDISVKREGSRGRREGRSSRMLLSLEDRVVGSAATLSAGPEHELRGTAFGCCAAISISFTSCPTVRFRTTPGGPL